MGWPRRRARAVRAVWIALAVIAAHVGGMTAAADEPVAPGATTTRPTDELAATTPEEVVAAYFAVIDLDGFAATSRFFHPSALAEFQTLTLPIFESEARDGASEFRSAVFGPEASLETLRGMQPARFYRRFMSFMERQMGPTTRIGQQVDVLGSVIEDGTYAHVVVRARLGPPSDPQTRVDVVSLERTDAGWGVLLSNELQGLAGALRPQGSGANTP